MKRSFWVIIAVVVGLCSFAWADSLSGPWKVTIEPADGISTQSVQTNVVVDQVGNRLSVTDPAKGVEATGSTSGKEVEIPLTVQLPGKSSAESVTLKGESAGSGLSGTVEAGNAEYGWVAKRLPSLWSCSNHQNPSHVASDENEMHRLAKKNGCVGWYSLRSAANINQSKSAVPDGRGGANPR